MENQKVTDTTIVIRDSIAEVWADSTGPDKQKKKRQPIQGKVEIYETDEHGNKQLVRKSNLVVYKGREFAAFRLTNVADPTHVADSTAYISSAIYWFGVGSGGVAGLDPFDPLPPNNQDADLAIDSILTAAAVTGLEGDYRAGVPGYFKTLFDSVNFEQDIYNDNKYLVIKFVATVGEALANGEQLNEAGLFASPSNTPGITSTGPFFLFARVTFPTILKNALRRLTFVWYIYV